MTALRDVRPSRDFPILASVNAALSCFAWFVFPTSFVVGLALPDVALGVSIWVYLPVSPCLSLFDRSPASERGTLPWLNRRVLPLFWIAYVVMIGVYGGR